MKQHDLDFKIVPELPGVYLFRGVGDVVLYAGRATDLRSRVRSYFSGRLASDRGARIVDAVEQAKRVEIIPTDSVLEAYILEANFIKKYKPAYNVVDKDDKSFQFVGITKEDFPRVLVVRGRNVEQGITSMEFSHIFGPFPRGGMLKEALRVLRKILPFRDSCVPHDRASGKSSRMCFRAQLGLCPGMCAGLIDKKAYAKRIREIVLFFSGKKKQLIAMLEREMKQYAKEREFEKAEEVRRRIFALTHIQDVALIKKESIDTGSVPGVRSFRIEAYDIAHLAGKDTVGVMVVLVDGEMSPADYRTFTIREAVSGDDIGALREILERRLRHSEWPLPRLIVMDGGKAHLDAAQNILTESGIAIPIVSVVKTEKHTPRAVLGAPMFARDYEHAIIRANAEAHRFAITRHRQKRSRGMFQ